MDIYDVIIVGGGPAGLRCAEILTQSDKKVLLLEKSGGFGDKLCAGGLTLKDMQLLHLPDSIIEHKISRTSLHSRHFSTDAEAPKPFLFTVDRRELGNYQRTLLEGTDVEVRIHAQVTEVAANHVVLKSGEKIGYKYLVGAEGYNSIVRRYLGLKVEKKLIGFQYTVAVEEVEPKLHIFMDAPRFSVWYAWIFPHQNSIAVGCCCDPDRVDHQKIKAAFLDWVKEKGFDPGEADLESYPIAYDYRGVKFGNVFLVGEAAGLASGFTGEGVYQSLASGEEVARMILDPSYQANLLDEVVKYNRILEKVMGVFRYSGPLKGVLQDFLVFLMNRKWIRKRVNAGFSG
jgi:flavin-dependent dehydrogenase